MGLGITLVFSISISDQDAIIPVEALMWSRKSGTIGLVYGLILGLPFSLAYETLAHLVLGSDFDVGLVLFTWLIIVLLGTLVGGIKESVVITKTSPNQGIRLSLQNFIYSGLLGSLLWGLLTGLGGAFLDEVLGGAIGRLIDDLVVGVAGRIVEGLVSGLVLGVAFLGFATAIKYGGAAVFLHFALRYVLTRTGALPWRLVSFLDNCVDLMFLRRVGGGYIFTHRFLFEYFTLKDFNDALERDPEDAIAHYNRGFVYSVFQRYDAALIDYTRATELNPNRQIAAQIYSGRGLTYVSLQQYDAALTDYMRVIEINPKDTTSVYNIACLYSAQRNVEAACRWLKKAIVLDEKYSQMALADVDFNPIRDEPCFQALMKDE